VFINQIGALAAVGDDWLVSDEGGPAGFSPGPTPPDWWREIRFSEFDSSGALRHTWAIAESRHSVRLLRAAGLPDGTTTGAQTTIEPDGKVLIVGSAPNGDHRSAFVARTGVLSAPGRRS
jgi:hypothetical protein